jgi:urease accessory protein
MMFKKMSHYVVMLSIWLAYASNVSAHPFHWTEGKIGLLTGLLHPLGDFTHLLSMLIIGVWLYQETRFNRVLLALLLISGIVAGCTINLTAISIEYSERLMYALTIALALRLAMQRKVPAYLSLLLAGSFAVLYGYVHALDIWLDVDALEYTCGFLITSALIVSLVFVICKYTTRLPSSLLKPFRIKEDIK